jgi:hypothetical protein
MKSNYQTAQNLQVGLLQIQTRIDNINQDLQNAKNAVARAEAARNLIDIKNYPYTVVVVQPVEVEELVKVSKMQNANETRYGGINYDKAMLGAGQIVANALKLVDSCQKNLNEALSFETKARQEMDAINTQVYATQSTLTSYQSSLSQATNAATQAQAARNSIHVNNYPYTIEVQRYVSTREWFKSGKWKSFTETRYGGANYDNAIVEANNKLQAALQNQSSWQGWVNGANSTHQKANSDRYTINSKLSTSQNVLNKAKGDLENAKNALVAAEKGQNSINAQNYPYTVIVEKLVESMELVKVIKMQNIEETRCGGTDYENAIAKSKQDLSEAIIQEEHLQEELNTALEEKEQLLQEYALNIETDSLEQIQQHHQQQEIKLLAQEFSDFMQIQDQTHERDVMGNN